MKMPANCIYVFRLQAEPIKMPAKCVYVFRLQAEPIKMPANCVYVFRLQAAAMAKFEEIKEQTTTGMAHAIEHHKYTDISVDLKPTYVLIPEKGVYSRYKSTILITGFHTTNTNYLFRLLMENLSSVTE